MDLYILKKINKLVLYLITTVLSKFLTFNVLTNII